MMKSFFKKLAFVMALAMVVSAMAPAATTAKAADAGLCLQESTTWEIIAKDELTVGETQDYKFAGAPTNWREIGLVWSSSKPEVATVDKVTGLVTTVAAGETVIAVKGEGYEASLVLTVKAKEVAKTFTVAQKTAKTAVLTFADATAATKDITVVKVISTLAGDKEMPCVLNEAKTKVSGNTVTIEPWVAFGTATYKVTANGQTVEFKTAVGDPAEATLSYKEPYTYAEAGKAAAKTLVVTDANGVEITSGYSVYYELVAAEPAGYSYVDSSNGDLYFYADNAYAVVKATIRYTVNNENKQFETVAEVYSQKKPVVTVIPAIDTMAVVPTASLGDTAKADKIVWGSSQIKIGDGTAQVVGLIKKSDNSSYSINNWSVGTKNETKNELGGGYVFKYASTDTSKVIVDELTGTLVGVNVTDKPAYILVTMFQPDSNSSTGLKEVGIVAAVPVDVQAKKAAQYVTLDKTNAVLLTDGSYTTVEVTPTTYNQYNEKMSDDTIKEVSATFNNKTHKLDGVAGQKKFTIDAKDVQAFFNNGNGPKSNYFVYKVTMNSGKTAEFYLTLKEVTAANATNKDYKLDVKGAEIKADKLDDFTKVSVVSKVLGESYDNAGFYYGKVDANTTGLAKDALYVVVLAPDKTVITPATTSSLTTEVKTNAVTKNVADAKLETLAAGVYTVNLYKVIDVVNGANGKVVIDALVDSKTFTVTENLPKAATDVATNLEKKAIVDSTGKITLETGAVTFKINGTAIDGSAANVTVDGVTVTGSTSVFVYSLKVKFTVGSGYVEITVPVNKTFTR